MRTIAPIFIVFVIAVSGSMIGMSGFADAWGVQAPETTGAQEELEETSEQVRPDNGSAEGPVNSGESSIVGLVVDGSTSAAEVGTAVILLPTTLMNLGFPAWFALPLGSIAYLVVGIGVFEFATNRELT
jgi:hypothetical protein